MKPTLHMSLHRRNEASTRLQGGFPPGGRASRTDRRVILWMQTTGASQYVVERRELTGVPDELAFAIKLQLAATMLERARKAGIPARWVAADEVYCGHDLRIRIRELGYDYAVAVPASHRVTTSAGRFTATSLLARLPRKAWQRLRAGHGTKGDRHYDWAMIEAGPDDTPPGHDPGHSVLFVRRHRYTGELSFYRCHSTAPAGLTRYHPTSATHSRSSNEPGGAH